MAPVLGSPAALPRIELKPSPGAVAVSIGGQNFASCGKFGFALKFPIPPRSDLLENQGAQALRYFPKGHIKTANCE